MTFSYVQSLSSILFHAIAIGNLKKNGINFLFSGGIYWGQVSSMSITTLCIIPVIIAHCNLPLAQKKNSIHIVSLVFIRASSWVIDPEL